VSDSIIKLYDHFIKSGTSVSTDSRSIQEGVIFFALKGDRFDGNNFAAEVIEKGASLAVVDSEAVADGQKIYRVENVLEALQKLARHHRNVLDIPVIGITGSNGKTTTKELLSAVLSKKYKVHATKGNLNNHIGVPLTILSAGQELDLLIVEMGANHIGDISELCDIADPSYGLITNIGHAHLEGFGSIEGVKRGKTELYKYLKDRNGTIFYNENDNLLVEEVPEKMFAHPYIDWLKVRSGTTYMEISSDGDKWHSTSLVGSYNAVNMISAASVGQFFDVSENQIVEAITNYVPTNNRSQILNLGPYNLIMDAYNANPSSMNESISSFSAMASDLGKILIIGDMAEMGKNSIDLHKSVIDHLDKKHWEKVYLVGPQFAEADTQNKFIQVDSAKALLDPQYNLKEVLKNKLVLIKASRSMKLEQIETLIK